MWRCIGYVVLLAPFASLFPQTGYRLCGDTPPNRFTHVDDVTHDHANMRGNMHHCYAGLPQRHFLLCHNRSTSCFFGAICGTRPITTLTYHSSGTRLVGAFHDHELHHGWRIAPVSWWTCPLIPTLDNNPSHWS